jgi:hypothetical protein
MTLPKEDIFILAKQDIIILGLHSVVTRMGRRMRERREGGVEKGVKKQLP